VSKRQEIRFDLVVGLILVFLSVIGGIPVSKTVSETVPYTTYESHQVTRSRTILDNHYWSLKPGYYMWWHDIDLSAGDRLYIDLRVVRNDVEFYISDGYGNEWMRQRTSGFTAYWVAPVSGSYLVFLDNSYSLITAKYGYLTLIRYWTTLENEPVTKYRIEYHNEVEYPYLSLGLFFGLLGVGTLIAGILAKPI
jgi:hypothetical protein